MAFSLPDVAMQDLSDSELDGIYSFAIRLGRDAGKILLGHLEQRRSGGIDEAEEPVQKLNAVDIVTKTDQGAWMMLPKTGLMTSNIPLLF